MNEIEQRGDNEAEIKKLYQSFQVDGEALCGNLVNGLIIVCGPYHLALFEAESDVHLDAIIREMDDTVKNNSLYESAWVVHYTEEVSQFFVGLNYLEYR